MMAGRDSYLDQEAPRWFTIPSGENFQLVLARGILQASQDNKDPFALHDTIVLVPTRRAVRSLINAFLQLIGNDGAVLLPQILPIGDVDVNEPPFVMGHFPLSIAPEVSQNERLFSLTQIILHRAKTIGQDMDMSSALAEAAAIGELIDSAAYEGVTDFSVAHEVFAKFLENQPEHIQQAARFLEIIGTHWPQYLAETGQIDGAMRRVKLLDALADEWTKTPTTKRVIAAGSTGSQPAVARLLRVIATLAHGCVVLPGFDHELDETAWNEITNTPGHPQHGMGHLLRHNALTREQVHLWPQVQNNQQSARRRRMINEALTPAKMTADWLHRLQVLAKKYTLDQEALMQNALSGLSLVEAENEDEEAAVLALAIRHCLQQPDQTAMLVTPDRALARRVRAALQYWDIEVDDSAGIPLPEDPTGVFLHLVLHWWEDPGDPAALMAMVLHPLATLGAARDQSLQWIRALDTGFLRGVRTYDSLDELAEQIGASSHEYKEQLRALVLDLHQSITQIPWPKRANVKKFATAHAQLAEQLAASDVQTGGARVWAGTGGEMASALFRSLIKDGDAIGGIGAAQYIQIYETFSKLVSVRPRAPKGGRVRILGPLEARQQTADLVLLGALDEGVWPSLSSVDPFLPRSLIRQLHLPDPERRLGLSAHDFAELASQPHVLLTRAARRNGAPSTASRWIWRLSTLCKAAMAGQNWSQLLAPDVDYLSLVRWANQIDKTHPSPEPIPRPPVHLRPKGLYVTRIKTLIRNPYAIYGQKILGLRKLDALGQLPGARERGSAIHNALEHWQKHPPSAENFQEENVQEQVEKLSELICAKLLDAGFANHDLAMQRPAAMRMAAEYLHWQIDREAGGDKPVLLEQNGTMEIVLDDGQTVHISAKPDRIDQGMDGFSILDYKTGGPPSPTEILAGFDPQLPVTALILRAGGFSKYKIQGTRIADLMYVKLSSGKKPFEIKKIRFSEKDAINNMDELLDQALKEVRELFTNFADGHTAYLCQPRTKYTDGYSDFDLLARRSEWSAILQEEKA